MEKYLYLKSINADYIDELFDRYEQDPDSVDSSWRYFFDGIELGTQSAPTVPASTNGNGANGHAEYSASPVAATGDLLSEARVFMLIQAYREKGKFQVQLDPLSAAPTTHPALELSTYGLSAEDLKKTFQVGKLLGLGLAPLSQILEVLKATYCSTIASEFTQVENEKERQWLTQRLESTKGREALDKDTKRYILRRLDESESFERFLHTRYVAQKRFSVEGGEGVIPLLDSIIENGAEGGAQEFVLGMAHRGRLNVLANLLGKKPEYIFTEYEGTYQIDTSIGEGDVKYHMGYSADLKTRKGKPVHLSLGSNPSHLEFINPVAEGVARAKQYFLGDTERTRVVPIQIHGDAAFAGQGVCYETLNLCQLEGFTTGGTIHIVINNQVGFTTFPKDSRSTQYCTDLAKMLPCPIFHVNGDDPEAIWFVAKLAIEFRQQFKKDVFIDLVCYRKYGHNEGDEPAFTQPLLYKKIKVHPSPREVYEQKLIAEGTLSADEAKTENEAITSQLSKAHLVAKQEAPHPEVSVFKSRWSTLRRATEADLFAPTKTPVSKEVLLKLSKTINTIPAGFNLHSKLARFFEARLKAVEDGKGIDWGNAETLAYASLILEGTDVRITGQDVERGTFTHRHAVLNDFETGQKYTPMNAIPGQKARLQIHNSHLSETGVMGFEYGYSIADPLALTIWEAQFGDFANGAQVMIDQFLCSGESKWQRMSGLVLLLPHGFEGQGPEHSSARLERFLQLCGRNNITVANLSTPAQIFHALRRQVRRDFRKPLIIMSPKSLLRHPQAISDLSDLTDRGFEEVLDDSTAKDPKGIKKVILCSGKLFYELAAARAEKKRDDVAILRLEQFYPWPGVKLAGLLTRYSGAKTVVWAQEEPRNMGGWTFVNSFWSGGYGNFGKEVGNRPLEYVGREVGAAPACGSIKLHEKEQKALIDQAFTE